MCHKQTKLFALKLDEYFFVIKKSGFVEDSLLISITIAGATKFFTGIDSTVLFGISLPVTQWAGASKCVPVCSFIEMLFQYQAGPFSSYCDTVSILNCSHWPNSAGRIITGNSGLKVLERSIIFILNHSWNFFWRTFFYCCCFLEFFHVW